MRLLERRTDGTFHIQDFTGKDVPEYAILSHTWHEDNTQEVIFRDLEGGGAVVGEKPGWRKLQFCADRAAINGLRWFWIDTCCIDKRSAVELQTAINSMFRWYKLSTRCYVYLPDVSTASDDQDPPGQHSSSRWKPAFRKSRWHTRGWTLQELIAPSSVEFFSSEGELLGTKASLKATIAEVTGISEEALHGVPLSDFSIKERELWATSRKTTIEEDIVYSLLGIFDVTMSLIYGEGKARAQRRLHNEIRSLAGNQSKDPIFTLPPRNRKFVGRSTELDALKQGLLTDGECNKMALVGLGGAGKTQIALNFAYTVKDTRPGWSIFWMPVLSMETYEQACGEVARKLKLPQAVGDQEDVKWLVQQALSDGKAGKWLLIVDNADNYDLVCGTKQDAIIDYLPESENGLTLFTTRNHEVAQALASGDVIEIEKMNPDDAMDYLRRAVPCTDLLSSELTSRELLTELCYLPLAISQAAAYINTKKVPAADYLRIIRNTEQDMIEILSTELRDSTRYKGAANAVATTWIVSFDEILRSDEQAANVLAFLSHVEWKAIPHSILPVTSTETQLTNAIGKLCSYSFVTKRDGEQIYDMHRLVHLATRIWLNTKSWNGEVQTWALSHLKAIFPSDAWVNRKVRQAFLPHVTRICQDAEDTSDKSLLSYGVGRCLLYDGRVREALHWLHDSYQWAARLEDTATFRLDVETLLSMSYTSNRQAKEAVSLLEHSLAIITTKLFKDHPDRLALQKQLASAYRKNGQTEEAIQLLEGIVTIRDNVLPKDDPSRLGSQHELALAYRDNSQTKEAIQLQEGVVAIRDKVLTEDNPHRLASQHVLASCYVNDGRIEEAMNLITHVVKRERTTLAANDPSRIKSVELLEKVRGML